MDKDILTHKKFIEDKIAELDKNPNKEKARDLLNYHIEMTRDFQHERSIHLAVTLFYAGLMIGAWVLTGFFIASIGLNIDSSPALVLASILTILEGFYIAHYYKLENRTGKLYALNKKIYKIIEA